MCFPSRAAHTLAIVLFATDMCFVILHVSRRFGWLVDDPLLSLYRDGGYAEWFQYTKELWAFLLLGIRAARRRSALAFGLSLPFLFFLLDDSLRLHENLGEIVVGWSARWSFPGPVSQPSAEVAVSATIGTALLVPLGLGYLRSDGDTRRIARRVLGLVLVLGLFGVAFDALHAVLPIPGLGLAEEAGELLVMSAIVAYVFGLVPATSADHAALERARPGGRALPEAQP